MMSKSKSDRETALSRKTSEKPVSLHPLEFDEALRDLLAVKPPKKDRDDAHKKAKTTK